MSDYIGIKIIKSATEPANPVVGQIWFDTGAGEHKTWSGTEWTSMGGSGGGGNLTVVEHGSNASYARPEVPHVLWIGTAEPANKQTHDLWIAK